MAGPNGAGKTTVTEAGLAHQWFEGCEYVNPDFIARDLGDWNDEDTVVRSRVLSNQGPVPECVIDRSRDPRDRDAPRLAHSGPPDICDAWTTLDHAAGELRAQVRADTLRTGLILEGFLVSTVGIEPTTGGLRVLCSTN